MTAEDWIFGVVLGPVILVAAWLVVYRVWRHGLDVSRAVATFSDGGPGYHAFLLPTVVGMTLLWACAMLATVVEQQDSTREWLNPAVAVLASVGGLAMLLGAWLWKFARPTFLVPPQFRPGAEPRAPRQAGTT